MVSVKTLGTGFEEIAVANGMQPHHVSPKRTSGPVITSEWPVTRPQSRASKHGHASNSDKSTSQHSLEKTVYILFCCNASRRIRFSSKGDHHERIHRHDLLRHRLHNPRV